MNKLETARRVQVVGALVEGCSINSTVRMTGVAKNTILKLLADLGTACAIYHDQSVRAVRSRRLQCDEIWCFCYAKDKNVPAAMRGKPGVGSVWTWTALDADTKLMVGYHIGTRDAGCAYEFMTDVASRLANRVQLTTDGHRAYLDAVDYAFGGAVDYSMLIKLYGAEPAGEARYSPPKCIGTRRDVVSGDPDPDHVSTSYVERQNLTMRMAMRRFTRLTNGFSKKVENLRHAVAIHYAWYNFVRIHQTLRCSPAMEAGLTEHLWSMEELVALVERPELRPTGTDSN